VSDTRKDDPLTYPKKDPNLWCWEKRFY